MDRNLFKKLERVINLATCEKEANIAALTPMRMASYSDGKFEVVGA